MKTLCASLVVGAAVVAMAGTPEISNFSAVQESQTRIVNVSYELSEAAIVTMEFLTNGVPVDTRVVRTVTGDVNKLVGAGAHTLKWWPYKDCPGAGKVANATVRLTAWATNSPPLFMTVDLAAADSVRFYPSEDALPYPVTHDHWKLDMLLMKRVYAAGREWRMGSPLTEGDRVANEVPHLVTLTEDFYMAVYPTTQKQYFLLMNANPSSFKDDISEIDRAELFPVGGIPFKFIRGLPADGADWPTKGHFVTAASFMGVLRSHAGNHVDFDLPTEAQWEFTCRADCGSKYYNSSDDGNMTTNIAWTSLNSYTDFYRDKGAENGRSTHAVGLLQPNAWGFYDMLGNIREWVQDYEGYTSDGTPDVDPVGPTTGTKRMLRGMAFFWNSAFSRCARRDDVNTVSDGWNRNSSGFRIWAPAIVK